MIKKIKGYIKSLKEQRKNLRDEEENKTKDHKPQKGKLIEKEVEETGRVDKSVYLHYMKAVGVSGAVAAVLSQIIYAKTFLISNSFLRYQ